MVTEFLHNFECIICNTIAGNKRDYERHLLTAKHKKHALGDEVGDTFCHAGFCCEKCNKNYKSRNGLWKHSKTCIISNNTNKKERKKREKNVKIVENITMSISEPVNTSNTINTSILQDNEEFKKLILEVVKSNNELQKQNQEFQHKLIESFQEVCKNNATNNNIVFYDTVTTSASGTWQYSTDGNTWLPWDSSADAVGNYIRYVADFVPSGIKLRVGLNKI